LIMQDVNLLTDTPATTVVTPEKPTRPVDVPEKFWDAATGTVRLDDLIKSYRELERRFAARSKVGLNRREPDVAEREMVLTYLGRPATPEGYDIKVETPYFMPDPDLHARLHALGFTNEQVQAVYDLAIEKWVPMMLDTVADLQAERELERVVDHFGGPEAWRTRSRQLLAFGRKNLPPEMLASLAQSFEGIMVLDQLMTARLGGGEGAAGLGRRADMVGADGLMNLVRDPQILARPRSQNDGQSDGRV
jgi:hypothetical protein